MLTAAPPEQDCLLSCLSSSVCYPAADEEAWAEQFSEQQQQQQQQQNPQLTPEEQKALRGPHPDDPLEDKRALSWVRQFNEEAAKLSVNLGMLPLLAPQAA